MTPSKFAPAVHTPTGAHVVLRIYDVTTSAVIHNINQVLHPIGTGVFHGAVEVFGDEWSYGFTEQGTGVFCCDPTGCAEHQYRECVNMGITSLTRDEVDELVEQLEDEWLGEDYDLLRKNCCTFSDELCRRLGVGPIPGWVTNLAAAGATLENGVIRIKETTRHAEIFMAAKANEFDERFHIAGAVRAEARHVLAAVRGLGHQLSECAHEASHNVHDVAKCSDKTYHVTDHAHQLSDNAVHLAARAAAEAACVAGKLEEDSEMLEKRYDCKQRSAGLLTRTRRACGQLRKAFGKCCARPQATSPCSFT